MAPKLAFLDRLNLNPRERKLVVVMIGVLGAMLFIAMPIGVEAYLHARGERYDELRAALASVQAARGQVQERQAKKAALLARYQKRAPALAGFIEQTASAEKLQVVDSVDRPDQPHGKRYVERSTVIHFKKANMLPFLKFVETIEKSGYPVSLSRLNVRKRTGEPDQWDIEVGLSAFDRNESSSGGDKDKDKDKKEGSAP